MKRAPKKLSTAMRLALHDLALVERSKKYKVNMGVWHTSSPLPGFNSDRKYCHVCFAGSIMAKTLKANPEDELQGVEFGQEWSDVFDALNSARKGFVSDALYDMNRDGGKFYENQNFNVESYAQNPKKWRKDMWKIVRELEKVGE